MAIRPILEVPDPRLKTVSTPVETFDEDLRTLVADMFETMYDAPGIGLAAIQVGVPKRVLVIDLQPEDEDAEPEPCNHDGHEHVHYPTKKEPRVFINPEILDPLAGHGRNRDRHVLRALLDLLRRDHDGGGGDGGGGVLFFPDVYGGGGGGVFG